jgi:hypothetical protein|tara:strand:+ start:592 stop:786 length:195 start_codon:yes stop_codon:yes gene_type:complete
MPDVTVSFSDAQWARILALSSSIKKIDETGDVDAAYLAAKWKNQLGAWVKELERAKAAESIDDF